MELYGKQFSPVRFYKCTASDGVCNDDAEVWMEFVHPIQKLSLCSVHVNFAVVSCLLQEFWVTSIPSKLIGSPWTLLLNNTGIYTLQIFTTMCHGVVTTTYEQYDTQQQSKIVMDVNISQHHHTKRHKPKVTNCFLFVTSLEVVSFCYYHWKEELFFCNSSASFYVIADGHISFNKVQFHIVISLLVPFSWKRMEKQDKQVE